MDTEEQIKYYQEQKKNWTQLGYDRYMDKRQTLVNAGFLSPYETDIMMGQGFMPGNAIREISGEKMITDTLDARAIKTSVLDAAVDVGNPTSGFVRIDGPNNRIVINDGTTNRIVIGNV